MMKTKTITLENEEAWLIEGFEKNTTTLLQFGAEVNDRVELLYLSVNEGEQFEFASKINAPNLKLLVIRGNGTRNFIEHFNDLFTSSPDLIEVNFDSTGISTVPQFILGQSNLERLTFRNEKFTEIPQELFQPGCLKWLSFEYAEGITRVPDEICKMKNLQTFNLWAAKLDYVSPELFNLPELSRINFAYCSYTPTQETNAALQQWLGRVDKYAFSGWRE
jgi:hypothetical protein